MITLENVSDYLADVIMDRPYEFFIENKRFCLWNPTLGTTIILAHHLRALGMSDRNDATLEAVRLAHEEKEKVCKIIAISSFRTKSEVSNCLLVNERADFFKMNLSENEIARLFLLILSTPDAETLMALTGINEDRDRLGRVAELKNNNMLSFGGLTIYGSLIAPAMEKFHMSMREVVWGISLVNLKMLLADNITSVYLSDDEAKDLGMDSKSNEVYGMTQQDIDKLKAMDCWE